MKTAAQVKQMIESITILANDSPDKKTLRGYKKQLGLYREVLLYLATNPCFSLIEKQANKLDLLITRYKKMRIGLNRFEGDFKKLKLKELNKEFRISELRNQRAVLAFILEKQEELV